MPNFRYQSLTNAGEARSGVLTAADRAEAVRQLLGRGETATSIELDGKSMKAPKLLSGGISGNGAASALAARPRGESLTKLRSTEKTKSQRSGTSAAFTFTFGRRRPTLSRGEMATFIREIATALEAGLPLMSALRTVRKQAAGKAMPHILDHLIEGVEKGDPLYVAAREYGPPFDDMTLGMLRAADASGEMSSILHQLADLLERNLELRREVAGAIFYPAIVAVLVVISVIVLVTVLVPQLIEPMVADGAVLPMPTRILVGVAGFIGAYWFIVLAAVAAVLMTWRLWTSVPHNRYLLDRFKLRVPILGPLLRDVAVARFTRTLGTLTTSGLPILEALRITQSTLGNRALMSAIDEVKDQVTSGKSLADPLERSGLFPPLLVQVVNLGERSGRLETMLLHAASAFDRRVNTSLKLFTKALPPILLIAMAGLGAFVLSAILLPLLSLGDMVGQQ